MSADVIKQPKKPTLLSSDSQNSNLRRTSTILNQQPREIVHSKEQKILNLWQNCLNQVELALTLQPDRVADIKDISLCRALQTHRLLCEKLERAEEQGGKVGKGGSDAQLKSEVKKSYKQLLRCFRDAPVDFAQIKQGLDIEMGKAEQVFYDNLKTINIHSALEGVKQEEALLKIKPSQASKSEIALDERIASVTKQMSRTDEKIEDCKASIGNFKIPQISETPLTDQEYQSYLNTPEQLSLQQELDQLNAQLNRLFLEDREKERDIQEGTDVVEGEIEYIIEGFDEKMEEMQADLEEREAELHKNDEDLRSLEELFPPLEEKYNEIVAKRLLADEKMIEEQRILQLKTKAAIIIQAWWKGYCIRKAMKNKAKKKGKKGKGKKK